MEILGIVGDNLVSYNTSRIRGKVRCCPVLRQRSECRAVSGRNSGSQSRCAFTGSLATRPLPWSFPEPSSRFTSSCITGSLRACCCFATAFRPVCPGTSSSESLSSSDELWSSPGGPSSDELWSSPGGPSSDDELDIDLSKGGFLSKLVLSIFSSANYSRRFPARDAESS